MQEQKTERWFPMRKRIFIFPVIAAAAVFIFGLVVMLLWNAILPAVFKVGAITYWQAVGLLVLCRILFGGFRGGPGGFRGGRPHFGWSPFSKGKWMNMSEEERAKFKEEWERRRQPPESTKT
jgi:hypothetical protein